VQVTPYADINELIEILLSSIQHILGPKLVALYLQGSLVIGDFDPDISDIDLVAALSSDIDEREFEALQKMHTTFANQHKEWDGRQAYAILTMCRAFYTCKNGEQVSKK
jgi:Domain of unknown function (DUF4111)/Nucleotidyltransferase domain